MSRTRNRVRRSRGRAAASPQAAAVFRNLRNPYRPIEIFSEDQIEAIHEASLTILEEIGLDILLPEAQQLLAKAGAMVAPGEDRVRFDRHMVLETLEQAPSEVKLHARSPDHSFTVGGEHLAFGTVGGPPNCSDLEGGRRPGTLHDFEDFLRLAQTYDVIHLLGPAVEPLDSEQPVRHLDMTLSMLTLTEKVPFFYARGAEATADAIEMVRIARQVSPEKLGVEVSCYTVVNANSPLKLDSLMLQGVLDAARAGQLMILTPFTLAGAMAPITLPGALAQQNAEALAGLTVAQLARPGAPVAYGGFTSNVDMKSGAPAFGTPEYTKAALAGGQLARRYGLPYRASNVNASNAPDAQAAYEAQMSLWGTVMGGVNLLVHGAGWLEGGLTASFEKFIIDVEMLQMMAHFLQPTPVDAASLALEAVREVGPGGHYFGAQHTLERYETAFYAPLLSDWRNFETWEEDGSKDATQRAHRIYRETLAHFEAPAMEAGVREELEAFVAKRKEEGGAAFE